MENFGSVISNGEICDVYLREEKEDGIKRIVKVYGRDSYEFYRTERDVLLNHSIINFPGLIRTSEEADTYSLVTEYIEGATIHSRVANGGPLSRDEARKVIKQVIAAVIRFYRVTGGRYVFCDLSPRNIIIRNDSEISIVDLNSICEVGKMYRSATPDFSEAGRHAGCVASEKSDIFSIGKLYTYMLTGSAAADAIRLIDKRDIELIERCVIKKDIECVEDLLGMLEEKRQKMSTAVIFRRAVRVEGSGEFALELAYALKNEGYRVKLSPEGDDRMLEAFARSWNADIFNEGNPDVSIDSAYSASARGYGDYHCVFLALAAHTYEIEHATAGMLSECGDAMAVFYKYDSRYMLPPDKIRRLLSGRKFICIRETHKRKISYETGYGRYISGFRADAQYRTIINSILGE